MNLTIRQCLLRLILRHFSSQIGLLLPPTRRDCREILWLKMETRGIFTFRTLTGMAFADRLRCEQERCIVFHFVAVVTIAVGVSVHRCFGHFFWTLTFFFFRCGPFSLQNFSRTFSIEIMWFLNIFQWNPMLWTVVCMIQVSLMSINHYFTNYLMLNISSKRVFLKRAMRKRARNCARRAYL